MTIARKHNGSATQKPLEFHYNPFEIAVCDPLRLFGDALADALAIALSDRFRVGLVQDASTAAGAAGDRVARLVNAPGRALLAAPRAHYGAPLIQPLIELDFVLVRDDIEGTRPMVVVVGDGPAPISENVVAYVGERSACPILTPRSTFFARDEIEALAVYIGKFMAVRGAKVPVHGLVLAGGFSTRMGQDKSAIDYGGVPQVRKCFELLSGHCDKVFVSVREEQARGGAMAALPTIVDRFVGFGPMGGILSAMTEYPQAAWCTLACDLPFVNDVTLKELFAGRNPLRMATAFQSPSGRPEPLCAIYEPKGVFPLHRAMAEGAYSLHRVLTDTAAQTLTPPDSEALTNVNTREEYRSALSKLESEGK